MYRFHPKAATLQIFMLNNYIIHLHLDKSGSIFTVEEQRKTSVCIVDLYTVLVCLFVTTTLNTAKFHDDIDLYYIYT